MEKLSISIEQKAKAYDEVLKQIKECTPDENGFITIYPQEIFPELKESEDERIRKTLIDYFNICHGDYYGELKRKDILAWLENQGEQKPIDKIEPKFHKGDWVVWKDKCYKINYNSCGYELVDQDGLSTSLEYGTINENAHLWNIQDAKDGDVLHSPTHNLIWIYKDIQHYHACVNMNYVKENFSTDGFIVTPTDVCPATKDEQTILFARMKEAGYGWDSEKKVLKKIEKKSIDKVKPKFKVGDWITDGYLYNKITDVLEDRYIVDTKFAKRSSIPFKFENYYHLWTIQDAKDGDVLISKYGKPFIYNGNLDSFHIGSYCGITTEGMFNVAAEKCYWTGNINIYPATKEQRDQLEKAMADARYTFDFEKKELKEIKQRPTWSETDNFMYNRIKNLLTDISIAPESRNSLFYWLKSLKGKVQPKQEWSEEDIRNIENIDSVLFYDKDLPEDTCVRLRNWLKSLKPQNTWKPSDEEMKTLLRTEYEKGRADTIAKFQKAWSEEDENTIKDIIEDLEYAENKGYVLKNNTFLKEVNWLKSLKDRVQPRRRHTIFDEII